MKTDDSIPGMFRDSRGPVRMALRTPAAQATLHRDYLLTLARAYYHRQSNTLYPSRPRPDVKLGDATRFVDVKL